MKSIVGSQIRAGLDSKNEFEVTGRLEENQTIRSRNVEVHVFRTVLVT